jgi:hypothetical protein
MPARVRAPPWHERTGHTRDHRQVERAAHSGRSALGEHGLSRPAVRGCGRRGGSDGRIRPVTRSKERSTRTRAPRGSRSASYPQPPSGFILPFIMHSLGEGRVGVLDAGGLPQPKPFAPAHPYSSSSFASTREPARGRCSPAILGSSTSRRRSRSCRRVKATKAPARRSSSRPISRSARPSRTTRSRRAASSSPCSSPRSASSTGERSAPHPIGRSPDFPIFGKDALAVATRRSRR